MANNPYIAKIDALVAAAPLNMTWKTLPEAKGYVAAIRQLKKELGLVKKEITVAKHQIHANSADQRNRVGKGFTGGAIQGIFGAKIAGKANASTKNDLRNRELKTLRPYEEAERHLAQVIIGLDKLKLNLESWIAQQKP